MLKLNVVKIDNDLYVKELSSRYHFVNSNKVKPQNSNFNGYNKLVGIDKIEEVFELEEVKKVKKNYKLSDPILSDKFPEYREFSEVLDPEFDTDEFVWKSEISTQKKYYTMNYETIPEHYISVEFEIESYIELSDVDFITGKYKTSRDSFISASSLIRSEIDKFIFGRDNLILCKRPCQISSKEMFDVIKQYVKQHIDMNCARIHSDYDHEFSVNKQVRLITPNRGSYKQGRRWIPYTTTYKSSEDIYKIYTDKQPKAPSFIADSEKELCEKIDAYLTELITFINTPTEECPHCKGTGHLEVKKFEPKN